MINNLTVDVADVVGALEKKFLKEFVEPTGSTIAAMRGLTIGLQDMENKRPLSWGSCTPWQPLSLVEEEQLERKLKALQGGGVIAEMDVAEKGL